MGIMHIMGIRVPGIMGIFMYEYRLHAVLADLISYCLYHVSPLTPLVPDINIHALCLIANIIYIGSKC